MKPIAFIIVDAHTDPDHGWNVKDHVPGLGDVLDAVGSVAVNRYSFELFR
jgi:hypothetical protein